MSGWPDPARPGVPLNPEVNGWHWLGYATARETFPKLWLLGKWCQVAGSSWLEAAEAAKTLRYIGPCPTRDEMTAQHAAEVEQARREGAEVREAAIIARLSQGVTVVGPIKGPDGIRRVVNAVMDVIRARGGSDAEG